MSTRIDRNSGSGNGNGASINNVGYGDMSNPSLEEARVENNLHVTTDSSGGAQRELVEKHF